MRQIGRLLRGWRVLQEHARRSAEKGVMPRLAPRHEDRSAVRPENAARFRHGVLDSGKEHHAEAAGQPVKRSIAKREGFAIRGSERHIAPTTVGGMLARA